MSSLIVLKAQSQERGRRVDWPVGEGEKDQQETKEQKQKPKKWKRNNGTRAAKEPGARREQESGRARDLGKRAQSGRGRGRSVAHHGQGSAPPRPTPL